MRGGSSPKKGGQTAQALGRSRGGFSTKIHVSVDSLGNPLRFILTGGQQHDITQAEELIAGYAGEHVLADKGYDAQEFRQHILELGMMPVIPPRSNRKAPADYDRHLYRERHLVECFINKMKHYRRIHTDRRATARHHPGGGVNRRLCWRARTGRQRVRCPGPSFASTSWNWV